MYIQLFKLNEMKTSKQIKLDSYKTKGLNIKQLSKKYGNDI